MSLAMPNIRLAYMYRDASNYKFHEEVILSNPDGLSVKQIETQIVAILKTTALFPDMLLFRPEWIGLPTAFPFIEYGKDKDDHDWHEVVLIEKSYEIEDDPRTRSVSQFLSDLERVHFDPATH